MRIAVHLESDLCVDRLAQPWFHFGDDGTQVHPHKLVIIGPVRLANPKLTGFDLGSKLGARSAFARKAASNPDTSTQNASLNARVAPEGTKADNINLTVQAVGVITWAGTVSPVGALNFKMLADLKGGVADGCRTGLPRH
jgi:hypothetical protein